MVFEYERDMGGLENETKDELQIYIVCYKR
jgi:hypothetical protein